MRQSRILSLGTRPDATTWEKGCKKLGFDVPLPIKKPRPTIAELESFFSTTPEWIFFGGHFGGLTLGNDKDSVDVKFRKDNAIVRVGKVKRTLKKNDRKFRLHEKCEVVLWGGCSVCSGRGTLETLRNLFGPHVLLGFAGLTGWKMVDAILGAGFIKSPRDFFSRVTGRADDPREVRRAWMRAARSGYGGGKNETRFRAIDPNGQEWKLQSGKIVKGRRIA